MKQTDRKGVLQVEHIVITDFGWIFREQLTSDYGIDAQIELACDARPRGELIAVQIKSGISYFREKNKFGIVFRFDKIHAEYWLNNSLPIIIVLYNPETKECIWDHLQEENIKITKAKNAKIIIPYDKTFDKTAKPQLEEIVKTFPIKKYNSTVYDSKSDDIFPIKVCPTCGSNLFEHSSFIDYENDEKYFEIKCSKCGWFAVTQ